MSIFSIFSKSNVKNVLDMLSRKIIWPNMIDEIFIHFTKKEYLEYGSLCEITLMSRKSNTFHEYSLYSEKFDSLVTKYMLMLYFIQKKLLYSGYSPMALYKYVRLTRNFSPNSILHAIEPGIVGMHVEHLYIHAFDVEKKKLPDHC